jgi:hypothetical protein
VISFLCSKYYVAWLTGYSNNEMCNPPPNNTADLSHSIIRQPNFHVLVFENETGVKMRWNPSLFHTTWTLLLLFLFLNILLFNLLNNYVFCVCILYIKYIIFLFYIKNIKEIIILKVHQIFWRYKKRPIHLKGKKFAYKLLLPYQNISYF